MPRENLAYNKSEVDTFLADSSLTLETYLQNIPQRIMKQSLYRTANPERIKRLSQQSKDSRDEFLTFADGYTIDHSEKQLRQTNFKDIKQIQDGIFYETKNGKSFFVVFPSNESHLSVINQPFVLNGASEELYNRQNPNLTQNSEREHRDNILFFYQNWETELVDKFYSDPITKDKPLPRYAETNINDYVVIYENVKRRTVQECGKIDFIGFGPDNQGIIIEFGTWDSGKKLQVQKQAIGLESLLIEKNHGLPRPPIKQYIGEYDSDGKIQNIRIRQSQREVPQTIFNSLQN